MFLALAKKAIKMLTDFILHKKGKVRCKSHICHFDQHLIWSSQRMVFRGNSAFFVSYHQKETKAMEHVRVTVF